MGNLPFLRIRSFKSRSMLRYLGLTFGITNGSVCIPLSEFKFEFSGEFTKATNKVTNFELLFSRGWKAYFKAATENSYCRVFYCR